MKKSAVETNEIIQILLTSLYEIIGLADMRIIVGKALLPVTLDQAVPVPEREFIRSDWENLTAQLTLLYGEESADGIAIRTGQEFFSGYFRSFGSGTSMDKPAFRMLPKPRRIHRGLEILSDLYHQAVPGLALQISQDEDHWYWRTTASKDWLVRRGIEPLLQNFTVGMIQEFLSWTSGGKAYPVHLLSDVPEDGADMRTIQITKQYLS